MDILGIGIETSCDETGLAVVANGKKVIHDFLFSQEKLHAKYGGVVPEIASRNHLIKLPLLLQDCLAKYSNSIEKLQKEIDYIAVSVRPGLVGSLLIGYNCALSISQVLHKPIIPVHHLEAHIYATFIEHDIRVQYPFIGCVFSGGNTVIYQVEGLGRLQVLGETKDDAAGEALDKAAKLLHLDYPGGKVIDMKARKFYNRCIEKQYSDKMIHKKNPFPKLLAKKGRNNNTIEFSFSGLKTALLYYLQKNGVQEDSFWNNTESLCFFYLQRVVESLVSRLKEAIAKFSCSFPSSSIRYSPSPRPSSSPYVIISGGVCANSFLREELSKIPTPVYYPSIRLCTDNGMMVAACGYYYYKNKVFPSNIVTSNRSFVDWLD